MRILLCDDHPIVIMSLAELFIAHGHEVVATAAHPEELEELVAAHSPDVCVSDLLFDGQQDAAAALSAIEEIAKVTDVVVVSGAADATQRTAAMAAGAVAVVSKAAPPADLVALVEGRSDVCAVLPRPAGANPYFLTRREQQVLQSLIDGDSTERMAARLGMRHATARSHVQSVLLKLGVHSRTAAVSVGVRQGLVVLSA